MSKKLCLIFIINFIFINTAFGYTCNDYLSDILSKQYNDKVEITTKKENIEKVEEYIGNQFISSLVYGKGYFKSTTKRRSRINYTCLYENNEKPVWGYVFPD